MAASDKSSRSTRRLGMHQWSHSFRSITTSDECRLPGVASKLVSDRDWRVAAGQIYKRSGYRVMGGLQFTDRSALALEEPRSCPIAHEKRHRHGVSWRRSQGDASYPTTERLLIR